MLVNATDQPVIDCAGDVLIVPVCSDGQLTQTAVAVAQRSGLDLSAIAARFRLKDAGDMCWVPTAGGLKCDDVLLLCIGECGTAGVEAGAPSAPQ